ncbi:phage tail tape measure protein [Pseudomonas sp. B392_1p]|uniref:phage tail tape measure protein n=1 Tax=Pseudomonas sp. B392_1p TaxID=3457507 RepID=UPI003FD1ADDF
MSSSSSAKLDFILRLTDQVTAPLAKVKMGFSELAEKGRNNITQMGVGLAGVVGAGVAITQSLQPALEMNRALGEVKSLGVAEDALDALNRKALLFSVAYGENAQDFVASAYQVENAIKGLTGSQLATFTQASNVLAKATKSDAATMTAYVGTMYNLHKGQADAMGKGAWVEALAGQTALAVQLFRTSGAQIGEAFDAAGGLASNAGVSLAEQMAVLGTAGSTMSAGDAGGAYREFFENVTGASEKLGMSFVDQQGKLLPMTDILDKLKGTFGDLSVEANSLALREAFGGNASRLLTTLIKDTDTLTNGMNQLGQVRGMAHAEQMAKTMVDPWQQFTSAVMALRIAFGQKLMPLLSPLFEWLTGIATTLLRWIDLFPNITRVVGFTVLAVLGLTAGVSALTLIIGLAKAAWLPFLFLQKIGLAGFVAQEIAILAVALKMGFLATWSKVAAASMWLFNAALWANPVTWVVIGIIALVAAIALAIVYWDEIVAAITGTAAFQWISDQLAAVGAWFDAMGGWAGIASAAWQGITKIFYGYINGLIEILNMIPGVNIETRFGDMPEAPSLDAMAGGSLSPTGPSAVPKGGLMSSIQNTTNQSKGNHVEKVEIHTGKSMSPLEMEQMLSMAVGG